MHRHSLLPLLPAALLGALAVPAGGHDELPPLTLLPVVEGLDQPVAVTHAFDSRLFLVERRGRILILEGSQLRTEPFLDIRNLVGSSAGEQGLLSVAFHPAHGANGLAFVYYTDTNGDAVIARYRASSSDPDRLDPISARTLLTIPQPFSNHNGGSLKFGTDGYLYIGTGDGGAAFDPGCNAQSPDNLLGKLLRIDVDQSSDQPPYHGIPATNPFVGAGATEPSEEVWALGLRNPWRFSFDRANGDLYLGDVGQNEREEIDYQAASSGGGENYGWKILEGTRCTGNTSACPDPVPACDSPGLTPPVIEYDHSSGDCSVIGGYVYRGTDLPELWGHYLYGDFCSGSIWTAEREGSLWTSRSLNLQAGNIVSFGEDQNGEIHVATTDGQVQRLIRADQPPPCLSDPRTLCLTGDRFRVKATWRTAQGATGNGRAVELTNDSGYLWFFSADSIELVVKVIDACIDPFNKFWVFAAGLTDVEVSLTVEDTENGLLNTYFSPLGTAFAPITDTRAFDSCP